MDPAISDHLRSTDPDDDDGIYRVVGTRPDSVTLLRVTDGNGRRAHTGEILTVPTDAVAAFEPAENPDGNRSISRRVVRAVRNVYWSLRSAVESLVDQPLRTAAGFSLFLGGRFGGEGTGLPESILSLIALGGLLLLVGVATDRL